jgi:predicted membrane protein
VRSAAGRWQLHDRTNVVAVMGGCEIDLREAELSSADVEITAVSIMGGIDILVPDGVFVEVSGLAVMGANENKAGADVPPPGAPVVRVKAYS